MTEFIIRSFQVDQSLMIFAVLLAAWAAYLVKNMFENIIVKIAAGPIFLVATLITFALFNELQLQPTGDKIINLAYSAGAATIAVTIVMTTIAWFWLTVVRR